jgi:glycolate oxidase iron-sulfur subunit
VNGDEHDKTQLLKEIAKCRACRFCVDVCPTYQASVGVESMSAYGRLQILKYLLVGMLTFDDSISYLLYSCLQCRRCETICKSKGQNIDISRVIHMGRTVLSRNLFEGSDND